MKFSGRVSPTVKNFIVRADAVFSRIYGDYRKLLKSLVAGIIATVTQMVIMFILMNHLDILTIYAYVISYHGGMVASFVLNKKFTFQNNSAKYHYQFLSFAAIAYSQLLITTVIFAALVYKVFGADTNVNAMASTIIAAFIGFIYVFVMNKSLTFKIFR